MVDLNKSEHTIPICEECTVHGKMDTITLMVKRSDPTLYRHLTEWFCPSCGAREY